CPASRPRARPYHVASALACPARRAISRMGTETYFRFRVILAPTLLAHGNRFDAAVGNSAPNCQAPHHHTTFRQHSYTVTSSVAQDDLVGVSFQFLDHRGHLNGFRARAKD
ncbi:MAG: hypothetical protein JXA21_15395, partial [Anaerolineae bacterium]|nr:hypothetical protein [Anaerolineae bacterium]